MSQARKFVHLGIKAMKNGEYSKAVDYYQQALLIKPEIRTSGINADYVLTKWEIARDYEKAEFLHNLADLYPDSFLVYIRELACDWRGPTLLKSFASDPIKSFRIELMGFRSLATRSPFAEFEEIASEFVRLWAVIEQLPLKEQYWWRTKLVQVLIYESEDLLPVMDALLAQPELDPKAAEIFKSHRETISKLRELE